MALGDLLKASPMFTLLYDLWSGILNIVYMVLWWTSHSTGYVPHISQERKKENWSDVGQSLCVPLWCLVPVFSALYLNMLAHPKCCCCIAAQPDVPGMTQSNLELNIKYSSMIYCAENAVVGQRREKRVVGGQTCGHKKLYCLLVRWMTCINTFAASNLNTQALNNSCLKARQRRP